MPLPQSMIRSAPRAALRSFAHTGKPLRTSGSRFVSTQPPHLRSRSWKSSALRWGIAIAGVYYYNTSPVFAEQPYHNLLNPNVEAPDESESTSALHDLINNRSKAAQEINQTSSSEALVGAEGDVVAPGDAIDGVGELEEEAQGQGAFNPETGEINWDCPCLGGMADGPCGPQFKEAFSCFVFSTEEPKGMDCIEKFQGMRDCFAEHPEHYKDELMEDEEIDRELEAEKQELVNQIAERRKADEAAASGYRLLEEPVAPPKPSTPKAGAAGSSRPPKASEPATQGPESQRDTGNVAKAPHQTSQQQPVPEAKIITGSGPQANPEQENIVEGQHSEALRKPAPPPVSAEASPESELVPKAAHDARNSVGPGGNKPEN